MSEGAVTIVSTVEEFDRAVLQSPIPVLVEFWAGWCLPCCAIRPIFHALAEELSGKIRFVSIELGDGSSTDTTREIFKRFDIQVIPTFLGFTAGRMKSEIERSQDKKKFHQAIVAVLLPEMS